MNLIYIIFNKYINGTSFYICIRKDKRKFNGFRYNFTRGEDWCQFEVNNHYKDFDKSSVKEDGVRMHLISRSNDLRINEFLNKGAELINTDPLYKAEVLPPGNILKVKKN